MLSRDVTDQLHHVYGFTYARAAEQADFTAFGERTHQVDNLDAGFQQFLRVRLIFIRRRRAVNRGDLYCTAVFFFDVAFHVDRLAQHVHDTAEGGFTHRNLDRFFQVSNFQTALQAVRRAHGDGTHHAAAQLLLNFQHQTSITILNLKGVVHLRYRVLREFDVNYGADNLDNLSSCHLESST